MSDQIYVPVEVLRRATAVLLAHVERSEGAEVALEKDYFWAIAPEQLYDVYNEPSELTIGQLTESLDNLRAIIDDPSTSISYALVWLADLMRAIGQTVVR